VNPTERVSMVTATDGAEVEFASAPVARRYRDWQPGASPLAWRAFELARAGDRDAAGFLYARYGDDVYRCAHALVTDGGRAGEATRRVFASLGEVMEWPSSSPVSPRAVLLAQVRRMILHEATG
jgi:hypothetical protein